MGQESVTTTFGEIATDTVVIGGETVKVQRFKGGWGADGLYFDASATTPFPVLGYGTYNASPLTLTDAQKSGFQLDSAGAIKVSGSFSASLSTTYNTTPPTLTNLQTSGLQADASANLKVSVNDGTRTAKVAAASTAPALTDQALIVVLRGDSFTQAATTLTDRSGTITTGGTAQQAAAANATRTFLVVHNPDTTTDLWFSTTGTASSAAGGGSFRLTPGNTALFDAVVPGGAVSVLSATTGKGFVVKEG